LLKISAIIIDSIIRYAYQLFLILKRILSSQKERISKRKNLLSRDAKVCVCK
jgi:hypothetical protein